MYVLHAYTHTFIHPLAPPPVAHPRPHHQPVHSPSIHPSPNHPNNTRACGWWRARSTTTRGTSRPCPSGGGATWRAPSSGPSSSRARTPVSCLGLAIGPRSTHTPPTTTHHRRHSPPIPSPQPPQNTNEYSGPPRLRPAHLWALGLRARLHARAGLPQQPPRGQCTHTHQTHHTRLAFLLH